MVQKVDSETENVGEMSTLKGSFNYLWDVTKPLGQGATSMVYRGRNKSSGEEVAVKVFSQAGQLRPMQVQMREFSVMQKLSHRNIVPLLAVEEEQGTRNKVIVMQLTDHGSLFNMLEDPKNAYGLPEEEFLIVFEDVTAGMKYIRDSGIIHRDIKPGNILRYVDIDGRSIYRLTDFGAAKEVEHEEEPFMSLYGTEEYLHPDIYEKAVLRTPSRKQFNSTVDLWSLGVTLFHVATGQLPFKPFGGRKNKTKMFEITRHKDSGVIMGVQNQENGKIEWSRELPQTCRLSRGLKMLITPIFSKLLESNPSKVWNFDDFFHEVDLTIKKGVLHVFCPHSWINIRVYINKEDNMSVLKELIAAQTDIGSSSQLLIFDGQELEYHVQNLLPVHAYPDSITESNPILCFNKNMDDSGQFPPPYVKEYPRLTSSNSTEDYSVAKLCSAIACYIYKEVLQYISKQCLVRRAVHLYIDELYHMCGHLEDYHTFLEKNCDSTLMWFENFVRTFDREQVLFTLLTAQAEYPSNFAGELASLRETRLQEMEQFARQMKILRNEVAKDLQDLKENHIRKRILKKEWNDSTGCLKKDRCDSKVEVIVTEILKTKHEFNEYRKKTTSFNDEQIHKYDKSKLSENCVKVKSIFFDHCVKRAREQFAQFNSWYRMGWKVRQQSQVIDKKLKDFAVMLEEFVQRMNTLCLLYHEEVQRYITNVKHHIEDKEYTALRAGPSPHPIGVEPIQASNQSDSQPSRNKKMRTLQLKELLNGLEENEKAVLERQQQLQNSLVMLQKYQRHSLSKDLPRTLPSQ